MIVSRWVAFQMYRVIYLTHEWPEVSIATVVLKRKFFLRFTVEHWICLFREQTFPEKTHTHTHTLRIWHGVGKRCLHGRGPRHVWISPTNIGKVGSLLLGDGSIVFSEHGEPALIILTQVAVCGSPWQAVLRTSGDRHHWVWTKC